MYTVVYYPARGPHVGSFIGCYTGDHTTSANSYASLAGPSYSVRLWVFEDPATERSERFAYSIYNWEEDND